MVLLQDCSDCAAAGCVIEHHTDDVPVVPLDGSKGRGEGSGGIVGKKPGLWDRRPSGVGLGRYRDARVVKPEVVRLRLRAAVPLHVVVVLDELQPARWCGVVVVVPQQYAVEPPLNAARRGAVIDQPLDAMPLAERDRDIRVHVLLQQLVVWRRRKPRMHFQLVASALS